ncbi:hypothetical protein CHUV2995_01318 [Corynebacterium diphtheriae subsp. lausannense]|nr:hypothetical protein CHUV2995_01318 [Corynebacterium diphtheriae subsp. lausannense]
MSASEFTIVPTTESDRTYIARLNFLTDVFGDEHADIGADFLEDCRFTSNNGIPPTAASLLGHLK